MSRFPYFNDDDFDPYTRNRDMNEPVDDETDSSIDYGDLDDLEPDDDDE